MKSTFKDFQHYVILNIVGQISYSCYTMTDTFFVAAACQTDGLTALNLAFLIFCILNGLGLMIGIGGGSQYAISRHHQDKANEIYTNCVYLVMLFSVFFEICGLFFSKQIVTFLGANHSVFDMTHTYLQILLFFSPAFLWNHCIQCFIRNDGAPEVATRAMVIGSISNIILDAIFIFKFGWKIKGAIIATGLAPIISLLVMMPYFLSKRNHFHFQFSNLTIKPIISNGISFFMNECTAGIIMFVYNFMILKLVGNMGVAAFSIITVISLVVNAIYNGLSQGMQPLLSRHYGHQHHQEVKDIFQYGLVMATILSILIYSIILIFTDQLVHIFNLQQDLSLQALAQEGMRYYFIACFFIGWNGVCMTFLASTERYRAAYLVSICKSVLILVPIVFLLGTLFGLKGVWCSYFCSETIVLILVTYILKSKVI